MSGAEGRRRMVPRMTRGSFRFTFWACVLLIVGSLAVALLAFVGRRDPLVLALATGILVVSVINLAYLLYVRRNDEPFWDEEEGRRSDFDRRGRQL